MKYFGLYIFIAVLLITFFPARSQVTPLFQVQLSPEDSLKVVSSDFLEEFVADPTDSILSKEVVPVPIKVALYLSDIYGKKEMEFTKGFLFGLSHADMPKNSVSLKMINGEISPDSLLVTLEYYQPDIIFTTQDKECPQVILDYAGEYSTRIVNVFDAKGESYSNSPSIVQLLIPSAKFNSSSAKFICDEFNDAKLMIIGDPEPSDALISEICFAWNPARMFNVLPEEIELYPFSPTDKYIVYISNPNAADVYDTLGKLRAISEKNPDFDIMVLGRPSWVGLKDLNKNLSGLDVFIPVKCYYDITSPDARWFIIDYKARFGNFPIKSYPIYSVMGYDVARYFLPQLYSEQFNADTFSWPESEGLQLNFALNNDNWFSGRYNVGLYILHYTPEGKLTKIPVIAR